MQASIPDRVSKAFLERFPHSGQDRKRDCHKGEEAHQGRRTSGFRSSEVGWGVYIREIDRAETGDEAKETTRAQSCSALMAVKELVSFTGVGSPHKVLSRRMARSSHPHCFRPKSYLLPHQLHLEDLSTSFT